ncbi:cytochrome c biogenesis CcdA family protein [Candidatus Riflebacteria bacterium]
MEGLFESLSLAVQGSTTIALTAAFIWGVLSIILSPCHLASIPLIVGFIDKQGKTTTWRAFLTSTLFALGILITIALLGFITASLGRIMGDVGPYGNYIVFVIFIIVGLHLLGLIPMPWDGPGQLNIKRRGLLAAFLLGLIFGIALGPCTFAFMAPIIGVTFSIGSSQPLYAASLFISYGIGHCFLIVLAGTFTEIVQSYLDWDENAKGSIILKKICGILVILGGIYLIYTTY